MVPNSANALPPTPGLTMVVGSAAASAGNGLTSERVPNATMTGALGSGE